jgi:GTP diphosphokinase / guanosine-3',5'-bis(diphosphate) 3'-diphosphatase
MEVSDLLDKIREYDKKADFTLIKKAYNFAEEHHRGQKRASGGPFIQHPLETAYTLAGLKLDSETITAALLHDVVEDTNVELKDLEKEFSKGVAKLVDGVTKIQKIKSMTKEEAQAESTMKVILASVKDIRVLLIKLADRTHNMETISTFKEKKRKRIARDALEVYAAIAHKLGLATIKWKLEDLAFKQLNTKAYNDIIKKLKEKRNAREKEVDKIKGILNDELQKNKVKHYEIFGRPKHIYSIYKKMRRKKLDFEDISDLRALRIITKNTKECYEILGIIHNLWTPIPREFDDYIANPKSNMYQSLHTIVVGPTSKPVEIQIRTEEMDKVAKDGIAAHWKYKGIKVNSKFDKKLEWMQDIENLKQDSENAKDFLNMLNIDLFENAIFTFTPAGKVVELPLNSVVLDFAFAVHTDIGMKCVAGKVNGHFVPLRWKLGNGDLVEIITSKTQHPSRDWLKVVRTSKARTKIKQHIRSVGDIPVKSFNNKKEVKKELEEWIIDVDHLVKPDISLSKCCRPLPGDKIIGFATNSDKVTVHKQGCPFAKISTIGGRRKKVNVRWLDNIQSIVEIKVDAKDRIGLFAEILNTLVARQVQIKSAAAKPSGNDNVEASFTMETNSLTDLQDIVQRIKKIKNVKHVYIGNVSNS